ncbi:ABC-type transport auxiliary lipoprotein family protein [uncultured Thiohalocapsa sp.]|uniref:ABC-type transport auxiliary lipoprotein family protein n=1 Tax=uncultured Thiohalocapsa sp. TaxID=768990 RepID=UPI0025E64B06|nr:ABC-type transport auxiliary lipoprotein family protein [uncultured Thiohalocapsa sp.]
MAGSLTGRLPRQPRGRLSRARPGRGLPVRPLLTWVLLACALSACVLLTGCGGGERLRDLYFSLNPQVSVPPSARPIPGTLRVTPISARGFVAGSRIVYRTAEDPLRVQRYGQLLWEEVPARALADDLAAALRAAQVFEHVITAGDPARANFLLTGELQRFEHRPTDDPPHVLGELSLTLVRGQGRQVLVAKTYRAEELVAVGPEDRTTPEAIVAAFNRLAGRLIEQVVADAQAMGGRLR